MRNIVLITLDSVRADHCSFMGYHRETTPTLDRMARRGLYFENAIVASLPTTPSMASVFTATYPTANAVPLIPYEWRKELNIKRTLAELLSEYGYSTGAFHSNPAVSQFFGLNKGFRDFHYLGIEKENPTLNLIKNFFKWLKKEERWAHWEKYYNKIISWIENIKEPFFIWILLIDTHVPYFPPKKYRIWGARSTLYLLYLNYKISKIDWNKEQFNESEDILNKIEKKKIIGAYDSSIRYADEFIKRLWKDLEKYDPIFIVHADHGDGFSEHGFYWHPPRLYEEIIHVPLVIYNADLKGRITKPVSLLGLAPTILELVKYKNNNFGSKTLLDDSEKWVITQANVNNKIRLAVRLKDWKYITGQKEYNELYNLKKDPQEQENVIDEYPDLVKEFKKIAGRHIRQELEKINIKRAIKGSIKYEKF
ncbi:MAG TPA: hypothetical protein ENG50_05385 [Candidatus Altiarchaeales archaeon]|nr:hypothetical protein [Candidatus Altiarchaeales archaeon]